MQLAEGLVVAGRFRLGQMLGRGGMGSVWRAQHLGLEVPCAVKFIEGEMASLHEAQARFQREAKAAAQLRSPHVVQILDHGVWEGVPYIAMELLEGEELGKRLARVGRLTPQETCTVLGQVCRALSKAHSMGIVHRDLKPENIFLVRDDDREIAKVLDFGIAKSRMQDLGGSSNTKTGAMLGTPYYMSPEQAQGTKQVDSRTDLWALAVIAFQALTGRLPFESEALGDLLVKIIVQPLPVPSQYGQVPLGFDAWWLKAAARDPGERFQSAKDFSDSLALVCGISQVSGVINVPAGVRSPAVTPTGATSRGATSPAGVPTGATPLGMTPQPPAGTASAMARTVLPGLPTARSRALIAGGIALAAVMTLGVGGFAMWKLMGTSAPPDATKAAATPGELQTASVAHKDKEVAPSAAVAAGGALPSSAPSASASSQAASSAAAPSAAPASPISAPPSQPVAQSQATQSQGTRKGAAPAPPAHISAPSPPPAPQSQHASKPSFNAGF
ncbi:MAG TPA: serine/threonine-protein kinase [Polyangiaceae bacterium]|nr:serine/threonine-protein kinase [Polyangiaceae bacterium]